MLLLYVDLTTEPSPHEIRFPVPLYGSGNWGHCNAGAFCPIDSAGDEPDQASNP